MIRRLVLLMAILWIAGFAQAKNLYWKDLPRYLKNKQITVVDGNGLSHQGRFVTTSADAIVVDQQGFKVAIPRGSLLSLTRHATRNGYVDRLSNVLSLCFAPPPTSILTGPVALLVFLAGLPVCATLDVIDRRPHEALTIKLLPDPK
jgi:hypothetical protein